MIDENEMPEDYKKLELVAYNITWKLADPAYYADTCKNYSVFELNVDFKINNSNNYIVNITFCCGLEFFRVNVSADLRNIRTKVIDCNVFAAFQSITTIHIQQGITHRTTVSYLGFSDPNLTELPDSEYIIWLTLFQFGETYTDSTRTKLTIRNGLPSFEYNYIPTINLPIKISTILCSLLIVAFVIQYKKTEKMT